MRAPPHAFPGRNGSTDGDQLGHLEALERWVPAELPRAGDCRVVPPKVIYHLCADNLAVSAVNSILFGLLLDAENVVKLPSPKENSDTRAEINGFVRLLHPVLRKKVKIQYEFSEETLAEADVVVAFGLRYHHGGAAQEDPMGSKIRPARPCGQPALDRKPQPV